MGKVCNDFEYKYLFFISNISQKVINCIKIYKFFKEEFEKFFFERILCY